MGRILVDTDVLLAYVFPPSQEALEAVSRILRGKDCREVNIPSHVVKETLLVSKMHGREDVARELFHQLFPCAVLLEPDQNVSIIAGRLMIENPWLTLPVALNVAYAGLYKLTIVSGLEDYMRLGVHARSPI